MCPKKRHLTADISPLPVGRCALRGHAEYRTTYIGDR